MRDVLKKIKISIFRFRFGIFHLLLTISIFVSSSYMLRAKNEEARYLRYAARSLLAELHSINAACDQSTQDYYRILRYCDDILPQGASLQLILPKMPVHKYQFLREKGRYFLYPRNYGNNEQEADFILVYLLEDFRIPDTYRVCKVFAENKYLLARHDCPSQGK